jgi:hypothetical protein
MTATIARHTAAVLTRRVRAWDRRRRLALTLVWLPRALMPGLGMGIALALVARSRPWLLPEEVLTITGTLLAALAALLLAAVWAWPRPVGRSARYFDRRFDLKERVSTALELAAGRLTGSGPLAELQLADATATAGRVRARVQLPLRVNWREMAALALLLVLLALLLRDNPQADRLRAERQFEEAIATQVAGLDDAIQAIERDPALTQAEQDALTHPLEEARDILQQPGVSQEEAVAALAEASQSLGEMADGMTPQDERPYQEAGRSLAGSAPGADAAQALARPDLGEAADALDGLADDLAAERLDEQDQQDLAGRLEQAAAALEEQNPALADKLREAAEALRSGDLGAAQEALREAGDLLRGEEARREQSALAEAARAAGERTAASQRELAQAGHDPSGLPREESLQQVETAFPDQAEGAGADAAQAVLDGQAGPPEEAMAGAADAPGEALDASAPSGEGGEAGASAGEASSAEGQTASGAQSAGETASGAGAGEGGAGADTTEGVAGEGPGAQTPGQVPAGGLQEYTPEHAPSTIGGLTDDMLDVGGQAASGASPPAQSGEFGPNPAGESALTYTGALGAFRHVVSNALESGRIPLDQRDVIHDYFSSLQR